MKYISISLFVAILILTACSSWAESSPMPTPVVEQTTPVSYASPTNIRANGILLPIRQMELSFDSGGFIEAVEVGVGETVSAGQTLVRLDSTETGLALQQAETELAAAKVNYDLVVAVTPAEQQEAISAANLELLTAQQALTAIHADADLTAAQSLYDVVDAQIAVDDAQRYLNGMTSTADQSFIDAAHANMILARARLDKADEDYEPWRNKPENNITRAALLSKLAQAQQIYDAEVRKYNGMLGSVSEIDLVQAEANLTLAQAQLSDAQETYQTLKEGPDPDEIALAEAQVASAQARLTLAEAGGSTAEKLALAQVHVDAGRSNLEILQAQVDNMIITAPFDGLISRVRASQGEYAMPGEMMVEVLDTSGWLIETKNVGELQIGQIKIGQEVQVSVNAFNGEVLSGHVAAISPIAIVQQGDTTYTLSIELEPTDLNLWPGMTAQMDIIIDSDS